MTCVPLASVVSSKVTVAESEIAGMPLKPTHQGDRARRLEPGRGVIQDDRRAGPRGHRQAGRIASGCRIARREVDDRAARALAEPLTSRLRLVAVSVTPGTPTSAMLEAVALKA